MNTSTNADAPVRFKLVCNRPAEVSIDLRSFSAGSYQVQPLFSAEQEGPPLDAIDLSEENGIFAISLTIPAEQADGVYIGAIVSDADNTACGTISVKL